MIALSLALFACAPETTTGDDPDLDDPVGTEDTADPVDDTEQEDPAELDCEDGADDDGDGLFDCADPDCGEAFVCTWPEAVSIHTVVDYDANDVAETFGVTDCVLELRGALPQGADGSACADCDLDYQGQVTYDLGSCPDDYISTPNPLTYGVVFIDEDTREYWTRDPDIWEYLGQATRSAAGAWVVATTEPVFYEVPLLGEVEVGTFTLTRTFTDE